MQVLSLSLSLYFGNLTRLTINKAGKICIMEQMQKTFFCLFLLLLCNSTNNKYLLQQPVWKMFSFFHFFTVKKEKTIKR